MLKEKETFIYSFISKVVNLVHVGLFSLHYVKKLGPNLTKGEWKGGQKKTFLRANVSLFTKKSLKYLHRFTWISITALFNRI